VLKTVLCRLALLVFLTATLHAEILPVSQIQKGMKGYGMTVFEGNKVEKFDVEILGVLRKIGPEQDLILARVKSELVENTGIIAGMSGSPIYIDGKIIGALAYAWQFAKEPIAAITPIEEMLRLASSGGPARAQQATRMSAAEFLQIAQNPESDFIKRLFAAVAPSQNLSAMGAMPISIPISFSGFSGDTLTRFAPFFAASGFMAVPAGTTSPSKGAENTGKSFEPGDTIGAVLIDGDFTVAATGTVTYVQDGQVYGFGHPFLDLGAIDFPMAQSEVVAIMPSLARSFKFSNTGAIVGALQQDRSAGIFGRIGDSARLIPVQLTMDDVHGAKTYNFQVVRNPLLFPLMVAMVTDSVVTSAQRAAGERTLRIDAEIEMDGFKPIQIRDGWAGVGARQAIPTYLALVTTFLVSNEFNDAEIKSLKVRLRHDDDLKVAKLLEASVEPPSDGTISPGDTVKVRALLKPYRGETFVETFEVKIPSNQKLGTANLFIGSGSIANQLDFSLIPPDPRNLAQVVDVLKRLRSATDLTVGLYSPSEGSVTAGVFLPNLPPSIQEVLSGDSSNAGQAAVKYHAPDQIVRPLDYIVDGALKVQLSIRQRL
jgi:SpoIVB peptidase S55